MAIPWNTTVTIDGQKFNAHSSHFEIGTQHEGRGMPLMGSTACAIDLTIDIHDTENVPFSVLNSLFELSHSLTRDKIKPVKIEYWKDERREDVICQISFEGWISKFAILSGDGHNHTLALSLQPKLDEKQFVKFTLGN